MGSPGAIIPVAGNITFQWTAIGNNLAEILPDQAPLLDNRYGNAFSADNLTWMQPSTNQSAQTLKTLTSQPNLITDPPGLRVSSLDPQTSWEILLTPLLGNASTPGVLIDAIPDANSTNKLINPVTGKEILKDVFGNPRNDGDRRDIGAVQVGASVRLTIAPDNTCANLSWTQPSAPEGNSVAGYLVQYASLPSGPHTQLNITGAMTTFTSICNLTEGFKYEFKVEPYYTDGGVGPLSNSVYMTAYGPFLPPTIFPSTTPTATEIFVKWTSPSLGGRTLLGYVYIYYPKDFSSPAQIVVSTANGATISGLSPGKAYVICIAAEATNFNMEGGSETAIGNCIDVSTGPPCYTLIQTVKTKRHVRSGSKFILYVSLRRPKGVKTINGIGVDLMLPTGVAIMDSFFSKRVSQYGIVNVTSSGLTLTGIVLEPRKRILKFPLQVRTCSASTIRLAATSFLQLEEPYGFRYCAQDFSWDMSCGL